MLTDGRFRFGFNNWASRFPSPPSMLTRCGTSKFQLLMPKVPFEIVHIAAFFFRIFFLYFCAEIEGLFLHRSPRFCGFDFFLRQTQMAASCEFFFFVSSSLRTAEFYRSLHSRPAPSPSVGIVFETVREGLPSNPFSHVPFFPICPIFFKWLLPFDDD